MESEIAAKADFSAIRYAQCWEDADVLLAALDIRPGDVCLSIASAGDNTLAMLTRDPRRVIAVDLSEAQLACLELRVAAYRVLGYGELLELMGSVESQRREALYDRCRPSLMPTAQGFWDRHNAEIMAGIGAIGKMERYFTIFRKWALPLVHSGQTVEELLRSRTPPERIEFYQRRWNTWRWRLLFHAFFSRFVMSRLGRDPSFFAYAEGSVASTILVRVKHAVTVLDPAENCYLQWILTGRHRTALPLALRPEHFETIRANLDRLEWHCQSLEEFLRTQPTASIDRFNLSDIFEYMSPDNTRRLLESIVEGGRPGGRLAYWNTFVPRSRPEELAHRLRPLTELSERLHQQDKAFFYNRFVVEEVV